MWLPILFSCFFTFSILQNLLKSNVADPDRLCQYWLFHRRAKRFCYPYLVSPVYAAHYLLFMPQSDTRNSCLADDFISCPKGSHIYKRPSKTWNFFLTITYTIKCFELSFALLTIRSLLLFFYLRIFLNALFLINFCCCLLFPFLLNVFFYLRILGFHFTCISLVSSVQQSFKTGTKSSHKYHGCVFLLTLFLSWFIWQWLPPCENVFSHAIFA